jgi:hypothetical protein
MRFYLLTSGTPSVEADDAAAAAKSLAALTNVATGRVLLVSDTTVRAFDVSSVVVVDALEVPVDPETP